MFIIVTSQWFECRSGPFDVEKICSIWPRITMYVHYVLRHRNCMHSATVKNYLRLHLLCSSPLVSIQTPIQYCFSFDSFSSSFGLFMMLKLRRDYTKISDQCLGAHSMVESTIVYTWVAGHNRTFSYVIVGMHRACHGQGHLWAVDLLRNLLMAWFLCVGRRSI